MNFKRLSSLALCFMLVFASVTVASANNPVDSLLNDTWRIISGEMVGHSHGTFIPDSAFDAEIQVRQAGPNTLFMIDINGGGSVSRLEFSVNHPRLGPMAIGSIRGGSHFERIAAGHYRNVLGSLVTTYIVSGDTIEYRSQSAPGTYTRLTLQRVSTIGTTPPPGGGGNGGGAGGGGGVGGGEGSGGGGGGCNAGFGLFALGFVALSFFYRKRA